MHRSFAYIVDAVRTPIGKYGGSLSSIRPDDLSAVIIKGLMKRNASIDPNTIEDVILGCTNQAGEDCRNVARMASLLAGLPITVGGVTVNRLCASGLQAITDANRAILCKDGDIYVAGGVESMSRAPFVLSKSESAFGRNNTMYDSTLGTRFPNKKLNEMYPPFSNGETAENVAEQWNVSRERQDAFALLSQQRYFKAKSNKLWDSELIPITMTNSKGKEVTISEDENPRETTIEQLSKLKPAFARKEHVTKTVTAGNSSTLNDGAAALLIVSEEAKRKYELKPMVRIIAHAASGVDPSIMGIGPISSTRKVVERASIVLGKPLAISDIGLFEINEAFAVQVLACMQDLQLSHDIVNVNGGAIALGHPLGSSGARITCTLLHEMKRRNVQYGIATMCIGMGQGMSVLYENI